MGTILSFFKRGRFWNFLINLRKGGGSGGSEKKRWDGLKGDGVVFFRFFRGELLTFGKGKGIYSKYRFLYFIVKALFKLIQQVVLKAGTTYFLFI